MIAVGTVRCGKPSVLELDQLRVSARKVSNQGNESFEGLTNNGKAQARYDRDPLRLAGTIGADRSGGIQY